MEFERVGSGVGQVTQHFTITNVPLVATRIEALIPASFAATGCVIQSYIGNAHSKYIFVGGANVTTDAILAATTGLVLTPGSSLSVDALHLHDTYVIAKDAGLALTVVKL